MATSTVVQPNSTTSLTTGDTSATSFSLEDHLSAVQHQLALAHWIDAARTVLDGLTRFAEVHPELREKLRYFEIYPSDPEWGSEEAEALRNLHQVAKSHVRVVQERLDLR